MTRKKLPLVSVIMNCFNGEKYLREAIDSVIAQTYQNWEIIFWDNQSTDKSAEIFKSYEDDRLKYYMAPSHTLLYEARNYAIKASNGEFIAFLDVDDWWLPCKLHEQIALFEDKEVGCVCSKYFIFNDESRSQWIYPAKKMPSGWILDELLGNYQVGLLTLVIRRVAFESLESGCDPRFHIIGDADLIIRLAMDWKVSAYQRALACYRIHGNNISNSNKKRRLDELELFVEKIGNTSKVKMLSGYKKLLNQVDYLNGSYLIAQHQRIKAISYVFRLPWGVFKIKLLILLIFPKSWIPARY